MLFQAQVFIFSLEHIFSASNGGSPYQAAFKFHAVTLLTFLQST